MPLSGQQLPVHSVLHRWVSYSPLFFALTLALLFLLVSAFMMRKIGPCLGGGFKTPLDDYNQSRAIAPLILLFTNAILLMLQL